MARERAPRINRDGTVDTTPGQIIEAPADKREPYRAYGELLKTQSPQLVAPLPESTRASLMSREERERRAAAYSSPAANAPYPSAEKQLSNLIVRGAAWGAQQLPFVSKVMRVDDLANQTWDVATSEDPLRESARFVGREVGAAAGERLARAVGYRLRPGRGADVELGEDDSLVNTIVGVPVNFVAARGRDLGDRIAGGLVDRYRTWSADEVQLPPRDELGRFTRSRRMLTTAASVPLDSDQLVARRPLVESLVRQPAARELDRHQLVRSAAYDDVFAATPAVQAVDTLTRAPLQSAATVLSGNPQATELAGDAQRLVREQTQEIVRAIEAQTTVLRQMGARPTASQAYAE
jgi:hypothetical protein